VAEEAGWSQSELHRLEHFELASVSIVRLAEIGAVLGLDMSADFHLVGGGLRDRGQQALLARFAAVVHASYSRNREVPFPSVGDRRSWDMVLRLGRQLIGVEAETRVQDIQQLVRRVRQCDRDGGMDEILLVLSNSAHNRALVEELRVALGDRFATRPRELLSALRAGNPLPGSGVILL
jgi:hypothetical protein